MHMQKREFFRCSDMADACVYLMESRNFLELNPDAPVVKMKEGIKRVSGWYKNFQVALS